MVKNVHIEDIPIGSTVKYEDVPDTMWRGNPIHGSSKPTIRVYWFNKAKVYWNGNFSDVKNKMRFDLMKFEKK